jgi:xanthine/CO dehydrogenase XdhC/CoxF family maturation factor
MNLIDQMVALTAQDEPFALATVITRKGSAPCSADARMLVGADGTTALLEGAFWTPR